MISQIPTMRINFCEVSSSYNFLLTILSKFSFLPTDDILVPIGLWKKASYAPGIRFAKPRMVAISCGPSILLSTPTSQSTGPSLRGSVRLVVKPTTVAKKWNPTIMRIAFIPAFMASVRFLCIISVFSYKSQSSEACRLKLSGFSERSFCS